MSQFVVAIEGLEAINYLGDMTPKIQKAMMRALNKTATRTRTQASKRIREQVNFPARFLGPSAKNLFVKDKATMSSLEATIRGRGRPTSLARFSRDQPSVPGKRRRKKGVDVTVKPGQRRRIKRAFIMKLRGTGGELTNRGLAVRTDGAAPKGAYKPMKIGKNLWLLYGPSVDQVLHSARNDGGVIREIAPETLDFLNREFLRLMKLDIA